MVQLKEKRKLNTENVKEKFQFLYGTIKSNLTPEQQAALKQFQFLYGTIKSN